MKSVLRLRIDGLINDLHNAHDPDTWWDYLGLAGQAAEGPSLHLWRRVLAGIYAEAEEYIESLEDARDSLHAGTHTEAETWALFEKVAVQSEYVFRECLELMGGLALRARLVDSSIGQIYRLSDSLIQEEAENLATSSSFAIPAFEATRLVEETVTSTLRRVARVRFPEWTLWSLPLVGYEYGYVAMEEPILARQVAKLAHLGASAGGDAEAAALRARVLVADALATYTLGPAYACSALLLRLQPFGKGGTTRPSDIQRGAMILATLARTGACPIESPPFTHVHNVLSGYWSATVKAVAPSAGGASLDASEPPIDAALVLQAFDHRLAGQDKAFKTLQWTVAQEMARQWWGQVISNAGELNDFNDDAHKHVRLRDVLNAAWLVRLAAAGHAEELDMGPQPVGLDEMQVLDRLQTVATAVCTRIAEAMRSLPVPSSLSQPNPLAMKG